jgi:hypothetical protein
VLQDFTIPRMPGYWYSTEVDGDRREGGGLTEGRSGGDGGLARDTEEVRLVHLERSD